jgi:hypothetical protein
MSKDAATRAMREARYAERQARGAAASGRPATGPVRSRPPVAPPVPAAASPAAAEAAPSTEGLCGHRSMNGRTCTRESGHTAKSHRYS